MIRLATVADLGAIDAILKEASVSLKKQNIDQWQNGYPTGTDAELDIVDKVGYVFEQDGGVQGYFSLSFGEDATYNMIYDGEWLTDTPYGVIHRLAVRADCRKNGIARHLFDFAANQARTKNFNMRIDTHPDNMPMQHIITTSGYTYCGIIIIADNSERLAYELNL